MRKAKHCGVSNGFTNILPRSASGASPTPCGSGWGQQAAEGRQRGTETEVKVELGYVADIPSGKISKVNDAPGAEGGVEG